MAIEYALIHYRASGDKAVLSIPDGTKKEHFVKWVENLPSVESPVWLGLPENAEKLLTTKKGQAVISKLYKLQVWLFI